MLYSVKSPQLLPGSSQLLVDYFLRFFNKSIQEHEILPAEDVDDAYFLPASHSQLK